MMGFTLCISMTPVKFSLVLNPFLRVTEQPDKSSGIRTCCLSGNCMLLSAVGAVRTQQLED